MLYEMDILICITWILHALCHYQDQCLSSCFTSYGITRPQWITTVRPKLNGCYCHSDFQTHCLARKFVYGNENFAEICSWPSNWLYIKKVKELSRQQAITWTNVGQDLLHHDASLGQHVLTHWDRVTHICVRNLTIIGSDNGLSPGRRQAITWTNVGILLIGPLGTNFSEMLIEIHTFSFKKIHLKMSSGKWRPFCLALNVLTMALAGLVFT